MPDHWQPTTLKKVADIKVGPAFKSSVYRSCANGVPIVRGMNIGPSGLRWDETFFWPADDLASYKQFLLAAGQTVVAMDATFASDGRIRAGLIANSDLPLLLNQRVAAINPGHSVLQQFVFLLVLTERFRSYLNRLQTGSFAPHISKTDLTDFAFDLPPLSEQRRIVDLVESIDNYIDALQGQIDATQTLVTGLLGDAEHKFPDDCWATIEEIAITDGVVGGPFGSSLVSKDYVETGVPVIRGQNLPAGSKHVTGDFAYVTETKADELRRNIALAGDIVATQRGTLGQVALVPEGEFDRYVISQSQMRLRPNPEVVVKEFALLMMQTERFKQEIELRKVATANPHINLGIFKKLRLPIPDIDIQKRVVANIESISLQTFALTNQLAAARTLRSGVLSELLSGDRLLDESYDKAVGW